MATPECPYFGECGGCAAQHIEYEVQVENKRKLLEQSTHFKDIQVFTGNPYHYRNRMDFIFHAGGLGLREKGNWKKIVDIGECKISNDKLNALLTEVKTYFKGVDAFDIHRHSGTYRYAVIRTPQLSSSISFVLNEDSTRLGDAVEKIKEFAKTTTAENVVVAYVPSNTDMSISDETFAVKGGEFLKESFLGKEFHYSIQGFFQNNHEMAEKMHEYVNAMVRKYDTKEKHLLDIYAGVGTFGIINAELFKSVTIIESVQSCIDAAKKNIELNNITNAQAFVLDAKNLRKITLQKPLFVITDPPRSGMDEKTILQLRELSPETIIYISCNLEQLGRDLPKFSSYEIKSAALFDFFPHTPHAEAVVELTRKSN